MKRRRRLDTVEAILDDEDRGDRLYDAHVQRQIDEESHKEKAMPRKSNVVVAGAQPSAVVPIGSAASLIQAITAAAANPQVDIEKMERLYKMHQDMVAREAEAAFNASLARVQSRVDVISTNAENTHTGSKYAKLSAIDRALKPLYTAEGFSISFDTDKADREGDIRIVAILSHAQGHSRRYHIDLPRDETGAKGGANKTGVQGAGSTNSYGRRYLTCMIFSVATGDDNDGNAPAGKRMDDGVAADHIAAIDASSTYQELLAAYGKAHKAAIEAEDMGALRLFTRHKDARKKALGAKS